jgi:hypothetical protein
MYVADRLVYTELHKTGGTHIGKWLARLVPGEQVGKHNRVPPALRDRFVIGSVRNPWDWYVSLWAYGCGAQGSVHRQTTRGVDVAYLTQQLGRELGREGWPITAMLRQALADLNKPVAAWQDSYADPSGEDARRFRAWLRLLLDPARRFDMSEGFGFSPVSDWAGLLTYRYLKLFTALDADLYRDRSLRTVAGVQAAWAARRFVKYVVRQEQLEDDLLEALRQAGCTLTESEQSSVRNSRTEKTNTSKRLPTRHYYDEATLSLVAERDALVIANHGYAPPSLHSPEDHA